MEELSEYKLFKTRAIYDLGEIFVVITGTKNLENSMINTEWYYTNPYGNTIKKHIPTSKDNRSEYNITIFDDIIESSKLNFNEFETIEECWEKETLENVKQAMYNNLIEPTQEQSADYIIKQIPKILEYKDIRLIELNKERLYHFNSKFLFYLRENTNCKSLMEILGTMKKIPKKFVSKEQKIENVFKNKKRK